MRRLSGIVFFFFMHLAPGAQEIPVTVSDSASTKPEIHSFYLWGGYGNSMTLATTLSRSQQYYFASFIYGYREALYFSASSFHLSGISPFVSVNALSLSYSHTFNSWFDISASISRYQIPPSLDTVLYKSFFYGDITTGFDWKILYTQVSAGSIFAEENSIFIQLKNSRYFQTKTFFKEKVFFSFDPYANMLFGSFIKVITSEGTTVGVTSPVGKWGKGLGRWAREAQPQPAPVAQVSEIKKYPGLLQVDFAVPAAINYGNLVLEIEPGYTIPFYKDQSVPVRRGFTLMVSLSMKVGG